MNLSDVQQRENQNVNYKLRVIMMCHCRFISWNRCPTLVGDVNLEETLCAERELYILLSFAVNPKLL